MSFIKRLNKALLENQVRFQHRSDTMYHATSCHNLQSIMKRGLIPLPANSNKMEWSGGGKAALGNNVYLTYDINYAIFIGQEHFADPNWLLVEVSTKDLPEPYSDEGNVPAAITQALNDPDTNSELAEICHQVLATAKKFNVGIVNGEFYGPEDLGNVHNNVGGENPDYLRAIAPLIDKIPPAKGNKIINLRFREAITTDAISAIYVCGHEDENEDDKIIKIYRTNTALKPQYRIGEEVASSAWG